jgi:anti-anti-sigma factor
MGRPPEIHTLISHSFAIFAICGNDRSIKKVSAPVPGAAGEESEEDNTETEKVNFRTRKLSDDHIVLVVAGSMTGDSVALFEHALNGLVNSSYPRITMDLNRVPEVSSLFVGHILNSHKRLAGENRSIRLCGYQAPVEEVFRLLNVDKTIRMEKVCPES